jgi:purine-binding chemotaxis protein CheW
MTGKDHYQESWLLCRAGSHLCALPLAQILEVMRPLPIEPLAEAPAFMRGIAVIRGGPVAVIDLGHLLGQTRTKPARFVTTRVGGRILGLAVTEVLGVRRDDQIGSHAPVPLLREAAREAVSSIGALDSEALLFLDKLQLLMEKIPS